MELRKYRLARFLGFLYQAGTTTDAKKVYSRERYREVDVKYLEILLATIFFYKVQALS